MTTKSTSGPFPWRRLALLIVGPPCVGLLIALVVVAS